MTLDRSLLALIGRRFPAVFDVIPRGPQLAHGHRTGLVVGHRSGDLVSLNPQPIPPGVESLLSELNPQPLPPRALGARVAVELMRLNWIASRTGTDVSPVADWEDDPCPTWPHTPRLPPHLGPVPEPDPGPDWLRDYHLGLAATLAEEVERTDASRFLNEALDRSAEALAAGLDHSADSS